MVRARAAMVLTKAVDTGLEAAALVVAVVINVSLTMVIMLAYLSNRL